MEYLVFPFGKYKGVELKELPSTYIVLALEKFDLPDELKKELRFIILGRMKVFSSNMNFLSKNTKSFFMEEMDYLRYNYEKS